MSALDFRERRLVRNRLNAGAGLRYGSDGITSPAEEAAARLDQHAADRALVAAELERIEEEDARFAAEAATVAPRFKKALATYDRARKPLEIMLTGGSIRVEVGTEIVKIVGLIAALEACSAARAEYEAAWGLAEKHGLLDGHVRIAPLAISEHLQRAGALAIRV